MAESNFDVVVQTSRGRHTVSVERLNTVASTYVPPHHELGGTDLAGLKAAQMTKTAARFVLDGAVGGCGQLDRYARMYTLTNPDA